MSYERICGKLMADGLPALAAVLAAAAGKHRAIDAELLDGQPTALGVLLLELFGANHASGRPSLPRLPSSASSRTARACLMQATASRHSSASARVTRSSVRRRSPLRPQRQQRSRGWQRPREDGGSTVSGCGLAILTVDRHRRSISQAPRPNRDLGLGGSCCDRPSLVPL